MKVIVAVLATFMTFGCEGAEGGVPQTSSAAQAVTSAGGPSSVCSSQTPTPLPGQEKQVAPDSKVNVARLGPELENRMKELGKPFTQSPDDAIPSPPNALLIKQKQYLDAVDAAAGSWAKLKPAEREAAQAQLKEEILGGGAP